MWLYYTKEKESDGVVELGQFVGSQVFSLFSQWMLCSP